MTEIAEANWHKLLDEARQKVPAAETLDDIPVGNKVELIEPHPR